MRAIALTAATSTVAVLDDRMLDLLQVVLGAAIAFVVVLLLWLVASHEIRLWQRISDPYRFGSEDPRR